MSAKVLPLALALCFASQLAISAPLAPPSYPVAAHARKAPLARPVAALALGSFNVNLLRTTLQDVRDAIGIGAIVHQGDAGASEYWLCYTVNRGAPAQRVWLVADGEMGGSEHRVTSVHGQRASHAAAAEDCPQLPEKFAAIRLDRGPWIGNPARANMARDGWTTFGFAGKEGKFDLTSELSVRARGGYVESVSASRITSN